MSVIMSLSLGIGALSVWFTIACYISLLITSAAGNIQGNMYLKNLARKSFNFTLLCVLIFVTSALVEKMFG